VAHRLFKLSSVVFLAGAGLALVQSPVQAQKPVQARHDLDSLPPERLQRDLEAEFYPILFHGDQEADDEEVTLDAMRRAIDDAFSLDARDDPESPASEVDKADLEAEMEEDGTSLEAVIDEALTEADELSARKASPSWTIVQVSSSGDSPLVPLAPDGKTRRKVAYNSLVSKFECHTYRNCGR
jgi:hypothetical protein